MYVSNYFKTKGKHSNIFDLKFLTVDCRLNHRQGYQNHKYIRTTKLELVKK